MLFILTQFLSNRSKHVVADGCQSKLVNVVSEVPQGSVFGPIIVPPVHLELFSILENKLIGYAIASDSDSHFDSYCTIVRCSSYSSRALDP